MARKHMTEEKVKFEGGATRSKQAERFDLIPAIGQMKTALRYGLGAVKHGENQWKKGGKDFIKSIFGHLEHHIAKLKLRIDYDATRGGYDDHIGAILWAGYSLAWFEANKPEEFQCALLELE